MLQVLLNVLNSVLTPTNSLASMASIVCCEFLFTVFQKISDLRSSVKITVCVTDCLDCLVPPVCPAAFRLFEPLLFKEPFKNAASYFLLNTSLHSASVLAAFEHAVVEPFILRKHLDVFILYKFTLTSKLSFLLKVLGKILLMRLQTFVEENYKLQFF
ncbi:hypothetical protein ATANTOWER_020821 [Ataeniobius toweri]|uniref:Uncharacterized protein n=1 Tax=Ataeniobius toweri TaxID=208326 RepID=A0ABU7ASA2_9TELE|nr:hypothetical protein [Ataeniobius toweri]